MSRIVGASFGSLLLLSLGCQGGPSSSSSSHWLSCDSDGDCNNWSTSAYCGPEHYCVTTEGRRLEAFGLFEEDFDDGIDPDVFGFEQGFSVRNGDLEFYTARTENAYVENGELVLVARAESYEGAEYTSASLLSEDRFSFTYGLVEARLRAPDGTGTGPSFWLMPEAPGTPETYCPEEGECVDATWPAWGDIVVMTTRSERPNEVLQTASTARYDEARMALVRDQGGGTTVLPESVAEAYHTYAVSWGPERIDWFIDGQLTQSFDTATAYRPSGENPFQRPFHLRLSLAVGGLSEAPNATVYPEEMRVEWIRITQYH